ncbi:acetyl/propionyl/methylcrotonyl-CoA carboxylase subunit alpha [Litoribrevibacter euphylliae]|uniref:Acetyl/propionyl/methylcrotonyl-CoA carboxylase subunit alpha n=1 Tax=Litoribrevibacter euphylliae TaxID=1834034 RepID=A0ABV7HNB7_9GAMM
MFHKILIANRGEIACRVIRTAKKLGVQTVAVYSDADANAQHVQLADEAVYLGAAPAKESYLVMDKVINAAKRTGAQAIHPGYGFLSENADFADACDQAGIKFIGPSGTSIAAMGSKSKAKALMEEANVPLVPGYHGDIQDPDVLKQHAMDIGFPLLIKASAGGGGKGMRVVHSGSEFIAALDAAKREAINAFGDDKVLLERYVLDPRHVEIQVFCDQFGHGVYLFERDCSIQRRHQKVVEEAPAPGVSEELRQRMGEAALRAAHAIGYEGAGTVEFLLDKSGEFFFMEMNTRLQVEHPVTEMISGVDLVAWQLKVANGEILPKTQDQLSIRGHAIEVRLYAEDPDNEFLPSVGRIEHLQFPQASHRVWARVDSGVVSGDEVSMHYDPMIAKVIAWGEDRSQALERLKGMLRQTYLVGPTTNRDYLLRILSVPAFAQAELTTHFIEEHQQALVEAEHPALDTAIAIGSAWLVDQRHTETASSHPLTNWRMNLPATESLVLKSHDANYPVTVTVNEQGYRVARIGKGHQVRIEKRKGFDHAIWIDGQKIPVHIYYDQVQARIALFFDGSQLLLEQAKPDLGLQDHSADDHGITAPMHGNVVSVLVAEGQQVEKGQALVIMEAMKMEHTLTAPHDGVVSHIAYRDGDQVEEGRALLELDELTEMAEQPQIIGSTNQSTAREQETPEENEGIS